MARQTVRKHRQTLGIYPLGWLCIFFLSWMLGGCGAGPVWTRDDPRDVLNGFLQNAEVQNVENMWEFLSASTQESLNARAEAFNAGLHDGIPYKGEPRKGCDMLRTTGHIISSTREYKKLEVSSKTDQEAMVDIVMHDGSKKSVRLHRESGRWAIDLPL